MSLSRVRPTIRHHLLRPLRESPVGILLGERHFPSSSVTRARKLRGRYLAPLKSLRGANGTKVKQTVAEKGIAEAVKLALSMKKAKALETG